VFTAREIGEWGALRPRQTFAPERLQQDLITIRDRYRAAGYYGATATVSALLTSEDSGSVDITVGIAEGKQTVLGALVFSGMTGQRAEDIALLQESRIGDPLNAEALEGDLNAVLGRYDENGFALAGCRIDSIAIQSGDQVDSATVFVTVEEGPRLTIDELRVEGNKETRSSVILREARLQPGEPFHPARISSIRERLIRLNIFSQVSEPALYVRGGHGGLLIRVQEGTTNTFDGIVGYLPGATPDEGGYVTGMVGVVMRNLFGTGRKLNLRWQKEDRNTQDLGVAYTEPWLFGLPLNAGGEFQQRRQDSTYVRQTGRLRAELMVSEALTLSIVGGSESVIPSSETMMSRVPRSTKLTIGAEAAYDTRNDLYNPTGGARYMADYHYGRKRLNEAPGEDLISTTVQRFGLDLEVFWSLFPRQVLAFALHGRQIQGGDIDESEMFRFGGANSLRGYRESQFIGSRIAWTNAEYRLLLGRRSFLYGFFDTGYYSRPGNTTLSVSGIESVQYGYGIGMRFDTPLGNLGVSFALGKGDSFAQGKVHFGIINEF
jgi:outer membrane protein insertion porin family